jgi:long-chain acyl-CoA synthetase
MAAPPPLRNPPLQAYCDSCPMKFFGNGLAPCCAAVIRRQLELDVNITHGLRRALQVRPRAIATIFEDRRRTWREIGDRVSRLATALRGRGLGRGDRIAVLMLSQDRYLECYLAASWAGAVIVPLNIRWSLQENADALGDCGASILVVDDAFAKAGRTLAKEQGLTLVYAGDGHVPDGMTGYEALVAASEPMDDAMAAPEDLAAIFYTGGTTGRSKGVMLSHRNITANAFNSLAEGIFGETAVYLHAAPMFHLANGSGMYSLSLSGGTSVIIRAFEPSAVFDAIERHKVTETVLVPTMIQMLADHPAVRSRDLGSLRKIMYGGSPITEAVLDRAAAAFPGVEFRQAYAQSELSPIATVLHASEKAVGERRRSGGRAVFGVEIRVVDDSDREVPRGAVGQICARGDNVMMGYWNRPDETAKAIIDGWMHTGDAGYMDDDGFIYVVDRVKDMIITGGENVYSAEVENVVASHPAVMQCAIIGIPSDAWGEAVHAIVTRKPGAQVEAGDIITFCRERIAHYKCPRSVDVRDEPLPMSGPGKILKRELRAPFWEGRTRQVG